MGSIWLPVHQSVTCGGETPGGQIEVVLLSCVWRPGEEEEAAKEGKESNIH